MKTSTDVIAIVKLPKPKLVEKTPKTILIDTIQDPGNLGTIIRAAHWFGFNQIICSDNSVDLFNYKVIQASMGAVFKIKVSYVNLENFIPQLQDNGFRILGTFMSGASIYDFKFSNNDIFILGNEGRGISTKIEKLIDQKITIPSFAKGDKTESLNISIAGAVICSEMAKSFES
jgi:TrmH family RNA methyltransferase